MLRHSIIYGVDPDEFCDLLNITTEDLFENFTELIELNIEKFDHLFTEDNLNADRSRYE